MRRRRGQRGIALVMVTWVFMILGVLAFDFARYMRDDAEAALNLAEETRNYYVAVGAMNRAIYDIEQGLHDVGHIGSIGRHPTLASARGSRLPQCTGGVCAKRDSNDDDPNGDDPNDDPDDGDDDD